VDQLEGKSESKQPYWENFFEQIKNIMTDPVSSEKYPMSASSSGNLPIQMLITPSIPHTHATFMALVDVMIPSTLGALDLRLDDYLVWTLDQYVSIQGEWGVKNARLSSQTARLLDSSANQLIFFGRLTGSIDYSTFPDGGPFAALSPDDRLEAITLLENLQVDLEFLPSPFRNNAGLLKNVVTALHQMVLFGYYSEWFSLGATRLAYPENHRFERKPFIWEVLNYPGPSFGYRAVRGFLLDEFAEERK
jgi:hypothetical protein